MLFISDKKTRCGISATLVYVGAINFTFCHVGALLWVGKKHQNWPFFVKIITLDFAFDIRQERSSCLISVNTESIRNSSLLS